MDPTLLVSQPKRVNSIKITVRPKTFYYEESVETATFTNVDYQKKTKKKKQKKKKEEIKESTLQSECEEGEEDEEENEEDEEENIPGGSHDLQGIFIFNYIN